MRLTDILQRDCVKVPLQAAEKSLAIGELVKLLAEGRYVNDYDEALESIMEREAVRSTGIGQGFAIPHGKTAEVGQLVMAIGKCAEPIEFESIDGQPVTMVILLVSPLDQTGPHIQALARISRMMTDEELRDKIWNVNGADQLYEIIKDHENKSLL